MRLEKPSENLRLIQCCTQQDENYPLALKEIAGRPRMLYYKGNIEILNRYQSIAVIGTRNISEQGKKLSYLTGKAAAEAGLKPEKYRYVERDRIQSGVSQGVLVIEADEKSGTMHTVEFALKQKRRLACYYHLLMKAASGNKAMEASGKVRVLKAEDDLKKFLEQIRQIYLCQQISLRLE